MKSRSQRRPSAAFVVALLALSAAVAGTAIAGPVSISFTKKEKRQVKKIAKNKANAQIKKKASGLSVAKADDAAQLGGVGASGYTTQSAAATRDADIAIVNPATTVAETTITVPAARTITAVGSVTAVGDGGGDDTLNCRTNIAGANGILFSELLGTASEFHTLAVTGSESVTAGTHTVQIRCNPSVFGSVTGKKAALSVIATG